MNMARLSSYFPTSIAQADCVSVLSQIAASGDALHPKLRAVHDAPTRSPKTGSPRRPPRRTMRRTVGMSAILERPAEPVSHELLGQRLHELLGALRAAPARSATRPVDGRAVGQHARRVDRGAGFAVLVAPSADGVEVLEREAERIDDAVAGVAGRIGAVRLEALAHRRRELALDVLDEPLDVRRRLRRRRAEDVLEHPSAAQHRRSPIRIRRREQHAALAEQAQARFVRELDAAKALAANVVDAVVAREASRSSRCDRPSAGRARSDPRGKCCRRSATPLRRSARECCGRRRRTRTGPARDCRASPSPSH